MTEDQPTQPDKRLSDADNPADARTVHDSSVRDSGMRSNPMIGVTVGQYTIRRVIGMGGMGTVFEAVQKSPRRIVAIKMMKDGYTSSKALRRFEFESQLLARLQHPGIAQVYDAGVHAGDVGEQPYFVMEYIPNARTLTQFANEKNLGTRERLELFNKVCNAVHHGHQKGIVHRDLKPGNILVGPRGEPRIIDFGVARCTDSDMAMTTLLTDVGALVGTLQYMSPEQVDADPNDIDTRSDVYALGVIFYELLTMSLPYDVRQAAVHEAARMVKEDEPTKLSTIDRRLRGDVETIARKALEKDRRRRYQSANELEQDIKRYLTGDPIEARPASMVYRLSKFSRKYRTASISAAVLVVAITAAAIIATLGWREAEHQKTLVMDERDRVEQRNALLDASVSELLTGVMRQVKYLGNSADAQRALLDLARDHADQLVAMDQDTPLRLAQVAQIWLRIARSHLNTSGVGYGSIDEAEAALANAAQALDRLADVEITDPGLDRGVAAMRLDHPKMLAEMERGRAQQATSDDARIEALERAAAHYRARADLGRAHDGDEIKALDVQYSSSMGLGNVLAELDRMDEARGAYTAALTQARELYRVDTANPQRRLRDQAICLHGLASLDWATAPAAARQHLDEAIEYIGAIMTLDPDNTRRPRDLATMLALRGKVLVLRLADVDGGVADYSKSLELFTVRAITSPLEPVARSDFQLTVLDMTDVLSGTPREADMRRMVGDALAQLRCVADAQASTGDQAWTHVLAEIKEAIERGPAHP